jgi:hypothetical protein
LRPDCEVHVKAQTGEHSITWRDASRSHALPDELFTPPEALPALDSARRRFYQLGGMTVQVESDIPFNDETFSHKFKAFEVDGPASDNIVFRHHFGLPEEPGGDFGEEIHRSSNWAVYRRDGHYIYRGLMGPGGTLDRIAVFNDAHTSGRILNSDRLGMGFRRGGLNALTLFPTDQIVIARALADRAACYFHSSAVILDGAGLIFVGHSEAGKSTILELLKDQAHPLCDDRNIVRRWDDGHRVHGSWSHGQVPIVSPAFAPLRAILLLTQSASNRLTRLAPGETLASLLGCLIKPVVTAEWWEKTLDIVEDIALSVPVYRMEFDKSGAIVPVLRDLCGTRDA